MHTSSVKPVQAPRDFPNDLRLLKFTEEILRAKAKEYKSFVSNFKSWPAKLNIA